MGLILHVIFLLLLPLPPPPHHPLPYPALSCRTPRHHTPAVLVQRALADEVNDSSSFFSFLDAELHIGNTRARLWKKRVACRRTDAWGLMGNEPFSFDVFLLFRFLLAVHGRNSDGMEGAYTGHQIRAFIGLFCSYAKMLWISIFYPSLINRHLTTTNHQFAIRLTATPSFCPAPSSTFPSSPSTNHASPTHPRYPSLSKLLCATRISSRISSTNASLFT